jgi:hypothetical protein
MACHTKVGQLDVLLAAKANHALSFSELIEYRSEHR